MDTILGRYKNLIVLAAILFAQIIGLAVQVHHDTAGDRLRARARFQPDAPLVSHRLIHLDRAVRPEADSVYGSAKVISAEPAATAIYCLPSIE